MEDDTSKVNEYTLLQAENAAWRVKNQWLSERGRDGLNELLVLGEDNIQQDDRGDKSLSAEIDAEDILNEKLKLDPLVALELRELRQRLYHSEQTVRILKEDASTCTFTSEGPLGRRLLDKCRKLIKENEELGEALLMARITPGDNAIAFHLERERFLTNQIRSLYEYNMELETQCAGLARNLQRMENIIEGLKGENEHLHTRNNEFQRRLERSSDRERSIGPIGGKSSAAAPTRANTSSSRNGGGPSDHRGGRPPGGRGHSPTPSPRRAGGRDRSTSFDNRDVDRRRRGGGRRGDM